MIKKGTSVSPQDFSQQLQSVQQMVGQQQFDQALQQLEALLTAEPQQQDALYMAAVCCRYTQQFERAQDYLDQLLQLQLEHSRAHQEQGHLLREQGQLQTALAAFQRATQINPALEASWRNQAELARELGQHELAQQALAQFKRLKTMPKALVAITDLLAQGKLAKAEELCRQVLQRQPKNVEAMRLLASIASRLGAMQEADLLLESACAFEPDNTQVRIDYIQLLRKRQQFAAALAQAEQLLATQPDNPQFQSIYAIEALQAGDIDTALSFFDKVLMRLPQDATTLTSRGHALKTAGDTEAAIDSYRHAAKASPNHCEAYYALANLKTYRFSDDEITAMQRVEGQSLTLMERVYLCFALAKSYEDSQQYPRAFEYYQQGNALKKQQSGYDASRMSEELEAQQHFFSPQRCAGLTGGDNSPDPIFILGLPRAGSTMLEQILSSHSQVDGTLELPNILAYSQELRRRELGDDTPGYPDVLADIDQAELLELGSRYLQETRIHRQQAPFFIDKMPNNFRHIGLIKSILPNAKIIDARRHPMACCFSAFKQLFAEGQEFSYSLTDVGQYYRDYTELMAHWDTVYPGQIHRVYYEQVVADLEGEVRHLLDYCGLPFEPKCLEFHKTERAVRTASSEQVRQPIYQSGVDQWQHFASYLGDLEKALGGVIETYPVDV